MNGDRVALDTNAAIAVLNGKHSVVSSLQQFRQIYLPVAVVAELRFGAMNSARPQENLRKVDGLIAKCSLLDATSDTASRFAEVRLLLKRKGRPIPENDLWIAAACLQHALPLATDDRHFRDVDGLQVLSV